MQLEKKMVQKDIQGSCGVTHWISATGEIKQSITMGIDADYEYFQI